MDGLKAEDPRDRSNTRCTFGIDVRFTQNATWQGQIQWFETNQRQNFRSALEMLMLMDEAISAQSEDMKEVTWQEA